MGALKFLPLIVSFVLCSCASKVPYQISSPERKVEVLKKKLDVKVVLPDGTIEDLNNEDRPVVLMFGQDTCLSCIQEAQHFVRSLPEADKDLQKVKLVTLLIGAYSEDAIYWKQELKIPWQVGIDGDSSLFKDYCPQNTVPCLIVHTAKDGIVLREHGIVPVIKVKDLVGTWE